MLANYILPLVAAALPAVLAGGSGVSVTPHDKYSSSVGVLGCKVNTDRIAYWPGSISCDSICISLSYEGRSVKLLRIDQSQGAHDVSYDAWNYLVSGKSARKDPQMGGGIAMEYEELDASECADLIYTDGNKLPLSASNSINYLASCLAEPSSWVAQNHVLFNVLDAICTWGYDEECTLDLATSNQPKCPHTLGLTVALTTCPVYDIAYGTGEVMLAGSGQVVDLPDDKSSDAAPSATKQPSATSQIISSVATTFSTRVASTIKTSVVVPPPQTTAVYEAAPETDTETTTTTTTTAPPATTTTTTPTTSQPAETPTMRKGGGFLETSGASDAALALWSSIFLIPVIEKWGGDA
jgi:hypothetical protein